MEKFDQQKKQKKWIERSRSGTEFYSLLIFHPFQQILNFQNLEKKLSAESLSLSEEATEDFSTRRIF
ncbi:hypothetical protein AFK68_30185 [Hydrocoleum sp. CS-953]|uniref:hypothetical protein n=1 Tax=Hydrocoleum sp. CS-953 TaxID=1671698 RepID=UPI000B9BCD7F|nr:hypothetical protein [Hydrocoleum sp. CS-953]OZH51553.1 hypothetical protein AFK68_30185 [Hydrocoleum sp. CS-953]